jgi:hypothetical protein
MHLLGKRSYLPNLAVFRCLTIRAMESTAINKGMIANQDSSGTVGVGVE